MNWLRIGFLFGPELTKKILDSKLYSGYFQARQKSRNISNFSNIKPIFQPIFLISEFTLKTQYV